MEYLKKLKEYPDAFEYCSGASSEEIQLAEQQLGVVFPKKYKQFLTECGMCNFGDTKIDGIFKTEYNICYPVVETTLNIRLLYGLTNEFIVLDFEEQEYLKLYKVSEKEELEDNVIYGSEVNFDKNEKMIVGKKVKLFNSFDDFFNDFLELGKE